MNKTSFVFNQKCAVDLHLHLDGSVSVKSARDLAEIEGISLPKSDEELFNLLSVGDDCRDLNEYLEKFALPVSLLQSEKSLEKCAYNICRELLEKVLSMQKSALLRSFIYKKDLPKNKL